jgi:glycosyltransferase involved in cell wall biosynthesis
VTRPKILHCHSTFALGGKEARAARLMNAFGGRADHVILSAVPDALSARAAIDPAIRVDFPGEAAPALLGRPGLVRYRGLAAYMRQFDLVLTYNWGAMDAVGARRLFPHGCPPLIHHEDGFNDDEARGLCWKRNSFRRLMLPAATRLVVPSRTLERIACTVWHQPFARLARISNGIDTAAYDRPPEPDSIPGFVRNAGDVVIGTLAGLRAVKNLPRLVRAVARLGDHVRLVIVGEGPEREAIRREAERLGIGHRVLLPGFLPGPHRYLGHFDIFALSSDSEQFPVSLAEAMAAGLPVVATDAGDVRDMVSGANRTFIVDPANEEGFSTALGRLGDDPALRQMLGESNRALARSAYEEGTMIGAYAALYETAMRRPGALFPPN